jgi:hypothetical protein
MTTRTYTDLIQLIQGLCGVDFATVELPRIVALINRRAKKAYNASNYWPRFLHVGEERTVTSNVIPYTESGSSDIGVFLRVHGSLPFSQSSAQDVLFTTTNAGVNLVASNGIESAFVTFKEAYTPAITSSSTDIPGEWFDYIAHGTYADFLRSEGQQEKAALADAEAADILLDELMLLDTQIVATRILTNSNMQSRDAIGTGGSSSPSGGAPDLDAIFDANL